jgi:hypothetical protein
MELFEGLLVALPDLEITHEFTNTAGEHAFFWTATASGRRIEGCDRITMDAEGRIHEIRVMVRGFVGMGAFAAGFGPILAERQGRLRGLIARMLIAPLRAVLTLADVASTRLIQRGAGQGPDRGSA